MRINEQIKALRKRDKLTQDELAANEMLRCNRQKIADWERGKSTPSADDIIALSKIFDVSTDYLLGLVDIQTADRDVQFIHKYTRLDEKLITEMNIFRQYPSAIIRFLNNYCYGEKKRAFAEFCTLFESYIFFLSEYNRAANSILSQDEQSILKDDLEKLDAREDTSDLYAYKVESSIRELMREYAKQEIKENEKLKDKHHALSWELDKQTMNDIFDNVRGESNGNNQET